MASVRALNSSMLSVFLEGERTGSSLRLERISLRTATGLLTASTSSPSDIPLQPDGQLGATWNFGPTTGFDFPPFQLALQTGSRTIGTASWQGLRVELQGDRIRLIFSSLRMLCDLLPGVPLETDATLVFVNGVFQRDTPFPLRQLPASGGVVELPMAGPNVSIPPSATLSLQFQAESVSLVASTSGSVTGRSGFAWERSGDRELQPGGPPDVFELTVTNASAANLVLARIDLAGEKPPAYFQGLSANGWATEFKISRALQFPFL
ncbi:MAG: hypothetical protein SFV51_31750, partial [Bryobacteraceae bacterium]|nr:hypothetical protein [Bryobacteraceae bacterium]